ncbi:hypothetical protein CEUSTIGMA_g11965.t1 [Chlamydomonas eustigma]|uniref:Uncharacterized protein n=1 Tax=Chlamydomonas eustigma TaxID=1157962 RepID=A0A250XN78_9CHLO|nr:hypothetical protein CEUSTIGMA_g11965.t1 [Chlamydomonas eustigma]|eukprot:GAX84544.1 hypothetical protein CEUSTIGMA_g11965.t1 [Chlamydomonas eustigma]
MSLKRAPGIGPALFESCRHMEQLITVIQVRSQDFSTADIAAALCTWKHLSAFDQGWLQSGCTNNMAGIAYAWLLHLATMAGAAAVYMSPSQLVASVTSLIMVLQCEPGRELSPSRAMPTLPSKRSKKNTEAALNLNTQLQRGLTAMIDQMNTLTVPSLGQDLLIPLLRSLRILLDSKSTTQPKQQHSTHPMLQPTCRSVPLLSK